MDRRLRRINLIGAWCPKVNRGVGVILVVLLGSTICRYLTMNGYFATHYYSLYTRFERVEVLYAAANETSREVFCKLRNTGNTFAILDKVRVNGTEVNTRDPLPITMEPDLDYKTIIFRYDGTWEGSILINVHTKASRDYEKLVDLQEVSRNPIEGAYPSAADLQAVYLQRHSGEIAQAIFFGSMTAFVVTIVLLVSRSRRKARSPALVG